METQLGLSMMCELAGVSRAGYYRLLHPDKAGARRLELRNDIQNTRAGRATAAVGSALNCWCRVEM
jgi:hypothetical protein